MMQKVLTMGAVLLLLAAPAMAQSKPAPEQKDVKTTGQKPADTATKPAANAPRPEPTANIRIDLTITDQRADAQPISKTITLMVLDTGYARIRTNGDVRTSTGFRPVTLNVDAQPRIHKDGKIRVDLTIEYRPTAAETDTEKSTTPTVNESLSVLLEDGKSLVISQSADPATDRKVRIEAKAVVVR